MTSASAFVVTRHVSCDSERMSEPRGGEFAGEPSQIGACKEQKTKQVMQTVGHSNGLYCQNGPDSNISKNVTLGLKYLPKAPINIMNSFKSALGKEGSDMRIEAYTQVQQIYQSQKVSRTQQTAKASQTDKVQISSFGKDIQTAKAALAGAPDIREDLTASIKARIDNGTYQVSNESFAEKLLKKYEEMR